MTIEQPNTRARYRKRKSPSGTAEVWLERAGSRVTTHTRTVGPNSGSSSGGNWDKCDVDACLGEAVIQQSKCVRHADAANRDHYLSNLFGNIRALSLRGVEITQELINEILDSPSISENRRVKVAISFWGADLGARLEFEGYEFAHWIELSAAILHEPVIFHRCAFKDLFASFTLVKGGSMAVQQSEFSEAVDLSYAHADSVTPQQIGFEDCSFAQSFTADGITGPLMLRNSRCESNLAILAASAPSISLDDCTVNGELDLANTHCATFHARNLRAASAQQVGPLDVQNGCVLSRARFDARVRMEVKADRLDLTGAQFGAGGHIVVERARVLYLDQLSAERSLRV